MELPIGSWERQKQDTVHYQVNYDYYNKGYDAGIPAQYVLEGRMAAGNYQKFDALGEYNQLAPNLPRDPRNLSHPGKGLEDGYYVMPNNERRLHFAPDIPNVAFPRINTLPSMFAGTKSLPQTVDAADNAWRGVETADMFLPTPDTGLANMPLILNPPYLPYMRRPDGVIRNTTQ